MWDSLWANAYKEFLQITRRTIALRRMLTIQTINFLMVAWLDNSIRNMPAVIVDQDHTTESRALVERIDATRSFEIKYVTSSVDQARDHIRAGRARVAIVVPPSYARTRAAGGTSQLLTLVDGSDSTTSSQAVVSVNGLAARMNIEARQEVVDAGRTVTAHTVLLFNPQGRTSSFMLPAQLSLALAFGYTGNAMRRVLLERTGGHLERLLMTPMSYVGLLVGKLVPWFVMGILNTIVALAVCRWVFDLPIRGDVLVLLGAVVLYTATALSLGSCIAAGAKNLAEANGLFLVVVVPSMMLSGYVFPLSSLPKWLLPISYAMPQTHFIEIMRGLCLRGASAAELAPHLLYFVVAPIVLSLLAGARFRKSIMS